jgi:hypothetical protein
MTGQLVKVHPEKSKVRSILILGQMYTMIYEQQVENVSG